MNRAMAWAGLLAGLALLVFSGAPPAGAADDPQLVRITSRLNEVAGQLRARKEKIPKADPASMGPLMQEQETDLTEYEALDLDRFVRRGKGGSPECLHVREAGANGLDKRIEELRNARDLKGRAPSEEQQFTLLRQVMLQRLLLQQQINAVRTGIRRDCKEEPPGRPAEFLPPGHVKAAGQGHETAPGAGHEKFDADKPAPSGEPGEPGQGKGGSEGKGKPEDPGKSGKDQGKPKG